MNDQSLMMNQQQHQMLNQLAPNQAQQPQMVNQMHQQPLMVSQPQMNYPQWPHNMPAPPMNFPNLMYAGIVKPGRGGGGNWKGKKPMDKRKDGRRKDKMKPPGAGGGGIGGGGGGGGVGVGGYQPPTLYELEQQNRLKARRFYHKKKFNRMGPYAHAPRNTTSYLIRAKKAGGIASLVSPCPVTPAVLPTPVFSPSREALVDMAKEEWGVDGYGSMKGLIRLRSPGHDEAVDDYDEEDEGGSSESDVEEHVEVERRLDHDLSRFEMIYPNSGVDYHNVLENRVDDQDTHIAQLEEENLILKERLYLMERELGELRRRLLCLERQNQVVEDINEEVVENVSENDSEGLGNKLNNNEEVDYVPTNDMPRNDSDETLHKGLSELAVKGVYEGKTVESEDKDVAGGQGKKDTDVGLVLDMMMDNKGVKLVEDNIPKLDSEDKNKKDVVSTGNEVNVGGSSEDVKSQPFKDACMGEGVAERVNDGNQLEGLIEETRKHDEADTQAKGNNEELNIEDAGDVSMGDALLVDKEVKDDQSDE